MSEPVAYVESLDGVVAADLKGFLLHWDFVPPAGTLLRILEGSSIVVLARGTESSRVCGYVAALADRVVCGYVSAMEVRPEFRGRGIGTELLRRVTERLDVYGIYLACAPAMIPYYEGVGFARVAAMSKRRLPAGSWLARAAHR